MDEEDLELETEVLRAIDKIYEYICDIAGSCLKSMPEECSPLIQ